MREESRRGRVFSVARALDIASHEKERFAIYRELWDRTRRYEILTDFPLHLDIELAGVCNLKCKSCFQNHITGKLGLMELSLYKRIIHEGAKNGLCAVKLQIRGEPLLHPELTYCIKHAKEKGILDVQMTTNATLLDNEKSLELIHSGLDGIVFSVDSHHEESCSARAANSYTAVEANISTFLCLKEEFGHSSPWVRIASSLPTIDHATARKTRLELSKKFPGADIIAINRMHDFRDDRDSYPDLHSNYTLLPCAHLYQRLSVFWDGSVTTCCMDYNNRFSLGNANHEALKQVWHSAKLTSLRDLHHKGNRKTVEICKHCHASTQGGHRTFQSQMHPNHDDCNRQGAFTAFKSK